jgi:hypothetical protein
MIKNRQIIINTKGVEIEASLFQEISFSFGDVSQSKHYQHRFHHEELPDGVQALFQRHNFSIYLDGGQAKKHLRVREAVFHVGSVLVAAGVVAETFQNNPENSAESMQMEASIASDGRAHSDSSDKEVEFSVGSSEVGASNVSGTIGTCMNADGVHSSIGVHGDEAKDAIEGNDSKEVSGGEGEGGVSHGRKVHELSIDLNASSYLILLPVASIHRFMISPHTIPVLL